MRYSLIFSLLIVLSVGCTEEETVQQPVSLIDQETYIDLYIELKILDSIVQSSDSLAIEDSLKNAIFEHYEISEEVFNESHIYYQSKPAEQVLRLQEIAERIEATIDSLSLTSDN